MTSLFNAYSTTLFARTTGRLVVRCCSSCGGAPILPWRRSSDHFRAAIKPVKSYEFTLTRFQVRYSSQKAGSIKHKTRKFNPIPAKKMEEERNSFFVVRKGDIVGVYKNLSDCQAQVGPSVSDPPVSVYKGYTMPKEAEEYMLACGLKNALYSIRATDLTEDLFGSLVPCPFQQPHPSIGESSDHLSKRRFEEVFESHAGDSLGLTSMSNDPARKHVKLEHQRACILEFDGASKGNPGQAGAGAVLRTDDGSVICRLREGLGIATNNVAEYRAMILGLKYALSKGFTSIRVIGDSKLVCMQVQGQWRVKHQNIIKWYEEAKNLKNKFQSFQIDHVLRNFNSDADAQANLAVDLADGQVQEVIDNK